MQKENCNFVQAQSWGYTEPPIFTTTTTSSIGPVIPIDIKEKTEYLLKIWEKMYATGDSSIVKQAEVREKILHHLGNLIDDLFLDELIEEDEDLKIPVPEEHTNYAEPDYSKPFVNIHFKRAVAEKEQREKENAEFIEFVKDLMRIAEANRQRNF